MDFCCLQTASGNQDNHMTHLIVSFVSGIAGPRLSVVWCYSVNFQIFSFLRSENWKNFSVFRYGGRVSLDLVTPLWLRQSWCALLKKLSACSVKNGLSWSKNGRNGSKESIQEVLQVCKWGATVLGPWRNRGRDWLAAEGAFGVRTGSNCQWIGFEAERNRQMLTLIADIWGLKNELHAIYWEEKAEYEEIQVCLEEWRWDRDQGKDSETSILWLEA